MTRKAILLSSRIFTTSIDGGLGVVDAVTAANSPHSGGKSESRRTRTIHLPLGDTLMRSWGIESWQIF